jgi:hypothetical protein
MYSVSLQILSIAPSSSPREVHAGSSVSRPFHRCDLKPGNKSVRRVNLHQIISSTAYSIILLLLCLCFSIDSLVDTGRPSLYISVRFSSSHVLGN